MRLFKREGNTTIVWKVERTGKTVTTTLGERWDKQKQAKQRFKSPAAADKGIAELVRKQRDAGFRRMGELDPPSIEVPREPALEAEIRKHRDDPAAYLVYADWLQGRGCALGELLAYAQRKKPKLALAAKIGVPPTDMATVGWRFGMWQWLKIDNQVDNSPAEGEFDAIAFARALFESPFCAALEELRIGMVRWDFQDQPALLGEAGKQAWAHDLVRLRVGDVDDNIDMDHHSIGNVGKAISKAFPNLESLWLHSGAQEWRGKNTFELAGLDLPRLRELTIETCAMSRKRMKAVTAAKVPDLERLELWFGERERSANATVADVAPLWSGAYSKLRHLGLRNTELVTDIVRLLPDSKLAKQLVSLDFSKGTFYDGDATELAAAARKFPALEILNVDQSWLTSAGVRALKAAFPNANVSAKRQQALLDPEEYGTDRYVAVSE